MSANPSVKETAALVLKGAKSRGIKDIKVVATRSRSVSVTYRKGRPDKVEESSTRSITVHLYEDGRYSACTTNDFRPAAFEQFLGSAVAMTRAMTPDPFRQITDPALYANRASLDLKLFDPAIESFSTDARNQLALEAEQAALHAAGDAAISAEASMQSEEGEAVQLHSNGFEGSVKGSQFWLFAEVSLRDAKDKQPSGWDIAGARFLADLGVATRVGEGAAARAKQQLGASKLDTAKMPMVVENCTAGRLFGGLLEAAAGRTLQQKRSFLEGKLGSAIGSNLLHLVDDPFIEKGFGSRLFDSEGISARVMPVFENGVFRNFYIDTYYGRKLGVAPTFGGRSNLVMGTSTKSMPELIAGIDRGVLVRGFIGGNTNSTTGDFSLGVHGTLIEKGQLSRAVSELNISGNHNTLWKSLDAVGGDPWMFSTLRVPSLVFSDIQFSGN